MFSGSVGTAKAVRPSEKLTRRKAVRSSCAKASLIQSIGVQTTSFANDIGHFGQEKFFLRRRKRDRSIE
jgi:hypothetical protein